MLTTLRTWLSDFIPYSNESWMGLIGYYNESIWPAQYLFMVAGLMIVYWTVFPKRSTVTSILLILSLAWIWCGAVFHFYYFSTLHWFAHYYGWFFIIGGVILAYYTWRSEKKPRDYFPPLLRIVMVSAFIGLPLLQWGAGHRLDQIAWFGITPDTTVLMTAVGAYAFSKGARSLVVISLLWSIIAFANSWPLGYWPGMVLLPSCLVLCAAIFIRRLS